MTKEAAPVKEANPEVAKTPEVAKAYSVSMRITTKEDGKQYEIGDDVSHFDSDRLKNLVERGLVKKG